MVDTVAKPQTAPPKRALWGRFVLLAGLWNCALFFQGCDGDSTYFSAGAAAPFATLTFDCHPQIFWAPPDVARYPLVDFGVWPIKRVELYVPGLIANVIAMVLIAAICCRSALLRQCVLSRRFRNSLIVVIVLFNSFMVSPVSWAVVMYPANMLISALQKPGLVIVALVPRYYFLWCLLAIHIAFGLAQRLNREVSRRLRTSHRFQAAFLVIVALMGVLVPFAVRAYVDHLEFLTKRNTLVSVNGTVTLNGAPLNGATVAFQSEDHAGVMSTRTGENGEFLLRARLGRNKVIISKFDKDFLLIDEIDLEPDESPMMFMSRLEEVQETRERENPPRQLAPKRFTSFATTPLTFEVSVDGPNKVEFHLEDSQSTDQKSK